MAVVFFSLGAALGQAGRMHDRAAGAMVLHEAVEKARHEKDVYKRQSLWGGLPGKGDTNAWWWIGGGAEGALWPC